MIETHRSAVAVRMSLTAFKRQTAAQIAQALEYSALVITVDDLDAFAVVSFSCPQDTLPASPDVPTIPTPWLPPDAIRDS